jgi:hypothetical protein
MPKLEILPLKRSLKKNMDNRTALLVPRYCERHRRYGLPVAFLSRIIFKKDYHYARRN